LPIAAVLDYSTAEAREFILSDLRIGSGKEDWSISSSELGITTGSILM
jgi:hypothetical protein